MIHYLHMTSLNQPDGVIYDGAELYYNTIFAHDVALPMRW